MSFNPKDNRDAWFVIRGFVYQVDLTILKWINLQDNQLLELERGEDIDVVTNDVNNEEKIRELGQVKHRDSNVTLNNPEVLLILRNFHDHLVSNPDQELQFSFITNSKYGKERPSIFLDGTKGIEAWIELFNKQDLTSSDSKLLKLQKYICKKIETFICEDESTLDEKGLAENTSWKSFMTYLADSENFLVFLKCFEWSMENDSSSRISETVKTQLVELDVVQDQEQAELMYPRLFLKVFKELSKSGIKSLSPEDLRTELALPEVGEADSVILDFIGNVLTSLDSKMEDFNDRLNAIEVRSNELETIVNDPAISNSSIAVFNYQLSTMNVAKPSLIKSGSKREAKTSSVMSMFEEASWINFQGINGCGKSQLATLLAEKFATVFWLDLRPFMSDSSKCFSLAQAFLTLVSDIQVLPNRKIWLTQVVNALPSKTIVVLNDLPELAGYEELHDLVIALADSMEGTDTKLLTTSNHKIKTRSLASLAPNVFNEYYDFNFDEEEVLEYLSNIGAPIHVVESVSLILTLSGGNPRFVNAIIYHLRSKDWGANVEESMVSVLDNKITAELLNDEQDAINNLISDSETKELLYRLSLIYWNFGNPEVTITGSVPEPITHPGSKFRDIVNIWIQELEDQVYQISPLIKNIGEQNLSQDTRQEIYKQLAANMVSVGQVDPITGFRSISLFIKAGDYNNACSLLISIYNSVSTIDSARFIEKWGFFQFWSDGGLPNELSVSLKAKLIIEQIRLYKLLVKDDTHQINSLKSLLEDNQLEVTDSLFIRLTLILNSNEPYEIEVFDHIEFVLNNWVEFGGEFTKVIDIEALGSCLWFPIKLINSADVLERWLALADKAESVTGQSIFENEHIQIGVGIIASQLLNHENQTEQNWNRAEELLQNFARYLSSKNPVLEATVLREVVSLRYNLKEDKESAIKLALDKIAELDTPLSTYLLAETIGKLLYKDQRIEESRSWLDQAITVNAENQLNYVDTLLYGASAFSEIASNRSVNLCERAVSLSASKTDINELDVVLNKAELGLAYWIDGNNQGAYYSFSDVVETLFDTKDKYFGEYWIRLFKWTGHSLGYIASEMTKDKVPETVSDGGEYIKPYQGIFAFNNKDLTDHYQPELDSYLCVHMAMIADAAGEIEKTYHWSQKGFDVAQKSENQGASLMISNICAPYLVINFKVGETLETQLLAAAVSGFVQKNGQRYEQMETIDLDDLYAQKPNQLWSDAEDTCLSFGIVPLFILLMNKLISAEDDSAKEEFFATLYEYLEDASDKESWEQFLSIAERIIDKSISKDELISLSSEYSERNKNNHRNICILGLIYIETPGEQTVQNLINVIPHIFNISMVTRSKIKYILLPFVQERCIQSIREEFVGSRAELEAAIERINNVDVNDPFSVQEVLKLTVEIMDLTVVEMRQRWLYHNDTSMIQQ